MKFQSIKSWLNEQKESKEAEPVYGCVMLEPKKIEGWEENHLDGIDEEDIFIKPNDDSYGLEEQPHITIVYGIHEDITDPKDIVRKMEKVLKPIEVEISEIDIFEGDEYDVVKYNVPVSKTLEKYRNIFLDSYENTQKFPKYNPHMTIAYVKPGTGKKYKKKLDEPFNVVFNRAVYSYHKDGDEDHLIRKPVNLEKDD